MRCIFVDDNTDIRCDAEAVDNIYYCEEHRSWDKKGTEEGEQWAQVTVIGEDRAQNIAYVETIVNGEKRYGTVDLDILAQQGIRTSGNN